MITTNQVQLGPALANAIADLGGSLTPVGNDWIWESSERKIRISPQTNAIHISQALNETPLTEQSIPQISTTLHRWLSKNATLPAGHRIQLQDNAHPVQQAIIPTHVDTDLDPSDLTSVLRNFANTAPPSQSATAPIPHETIETWAAEAKVHLTANADGEESAPRYAIKLRGFEPARLEITDHVSLHIDASPLLENFGTSASDTACALLAMGATAPSVFIRPELSDDSLRYRATFANTKNSIPPASWLTQAVREITATLRHSRTELEALHSDSQLASQYLTIRNITPKS